MTGWPWWGTVLFLAGIFLVSVLVGVLADRWSAADAAKHSI